LDYHEFVIFKATSNFSKH